MSITSSQEHEADRLRRHLRALSAVNAQLHAQLDGGGRRVDGRGDLLGGDGDGRLSTLSIRRASAGSEWIEQLQLFGSVSDPVLVRNRKRGNFLVEGPLRRQVKAGMLFVALEGLLGAAREVSEGELDRWNEGPPVEVLEAPSGAAFVIVAGRRLTLRGLPLPHPVTAEEMLRFPEGAELRVGVSSARTAGASAGRVKRALARVKRDGPVRAGAAFVKRAVRRATRSARAGEVTPKGRDVRRGVIRAQSDVLAAESFDDIPESFRARPVSVSPTLDPGVRRGGGGCPADYACVVVGVFVVGMHRSGTSAVAAALEALGLDVGAPELHMAADVGNPAGYFELQEIGDLNDEILDLLGGGWDCPPQRVEGWELEPAMAPYYRQAAAVVGTRLAKQRWLIKDPRITLLLPLWRRAVLDRCAAVLVVRDPMEVAWSLALRNAMPILTGLALWSDYNRHALAGLGGLPVHVCNYDALVADPLATMTAVAQSLDTWNELPGDASDAKIAAAAARVRPELRRNTWPRDNADVLEIPGEIERLVKYLADLEGGHAVFEPGHPPPSPWEDALLVERRIGVVRHRIATAQAETAFQLRDEATREWHSIGHQLHARNLEFDALLASLEAEKARYLRLGGELDTVRARLAEVEADLAEVQQRRRDAEKALRASTRKLETLEASLPVRIARGFKRIRGKVGRGA